MADLARLGRRSYVSLNGLENVLKELKALERLPDASSRATIKRAREADCKVNTALGPTFSSLRIQVNELDRRQGTTSVRENELPFISLPAVLSHAIATSWTGSGHARMGPRAHGRLFSMQMRLHLAMP